MSNFPLTAYSKLADGTDEDLIVAGTVRLKWLYLFNTSAALRYVKLYNKATAPSEADTPVLRFPIPIGGGGTVALPDGGIPFSLGLGIRIVTGVTDADDTGPTANDVVANLGYDPG